MSSCQRDDAPRSTEQVSPLQGAFVSGGEACLVDPGLLRDEVEALVGELAGAKLRYVILTHADWDHVLGPEHLPPTIVAQRSYADELDAEGTRAVLARLEEHAGVARARPFEAPLPNETFDTVLTLPVGDLELRLAHAPGHTKSMLTVFEPESKALWAGDLLSDVEIPSVIHDLASYRRTLASLAGREIARLVPGHGSQTEDASEIRRRQEEDADYLARLESAVAEAVGAGRSLQETVAACGPVSPRRSDGDETTHRLNVEKVYADLGGDADPNEVGYVRAWKEEVAG